MLLRSSLFATCALAVASAWLAVDARDARACGGCFHAPPGPTETVTTTVTDHRMVLSISNLQTVLWDQVRYAGNPSDFAWVLPVKPGARIELSQDAWIASLDASTQTVIQGPTTSCGGAAPTEYDGSGGGGCGFSGGANESAAAFGSSGEADAGESAVQVVSQQVVGPYDAVTVRSSQGEALGDWLRANGYEVGASMQPTIDSFSAAGFDFIALKLAPGEGVQAMQPVRVITAGADPSLPLRMVAAGAGARVGIELFVLSEGRYHPQNFPDVTIDFTKLAWDPSQGRSNYTVLAAAALASGGGNGWLTEGAQPVNLFASGGFNPALATAYQAACAPVTLAPPASCGAAPEAGTGAAEAGAVDSGEGKDAGTPADAGDGGVEAAVEAGTDAAIEAGTDGGAEAGTDGGVEAGSCQATIVPCDDLTLAMTGIDMGSLWVTRLRADLPATALATDLVLEASSLQVEAPNVHQSSTYTTPNYNPCATGNGVSSSNGNNGNGSGACAMDGSPRTRYADALLGGAALVLIGGVARRRRRACAPG